MPSNSKTSTEKVEKPQPIGLLVMLRTETSGNTVEEKVTTLISKSPILSTADATVQLVDKLSRQSFSQAATIEIMEKWLDCLVNGHALQTIHKNDRQTWRTVQFEAYIQSMTVEEFAAWEKDTQKKAAPGVGRRWSACAACGERHNPHYACPEDDEDED